MLLPTRILLISIVHWCTYNLIAKSISQNALLLSLLKNVELGLLWAIPVVSYAALLCRQLILRSYAKLKLSQNQASEASNKTNQSLLNMEFLIARQTTKLEDGINQLQTELTKRLQVKESLLYLSKAVEEVSDALCITDANGLPTDINKAFLQLFGYSIDEWH